MKYDNKYKTTGNTFFQDQFLIGVTGIIFNDKNEVLLFKHTYRLHAWSLPGGYLKSGEHPAEALEREIKEESGLVVSVDESLKTALIVTPLV